MSSYHKIAKKGKKLIQGCDVYISREHFAGGWNLEKSKWCIPPEISTNNYEKHFNGSELRNEIYELAYQDLGCWCKNITQCHANVLLNKVNDYLSLESKYIENTNYPSIQIAKVPIFHAKKRTKQQQKKRAYKRIKFEDNYNYPAELDIFSLLKNPLIIYEYWHEWPFNMPRDDKLQPPNDIEFSLNDGQFKVIYKPMKPIVPKFDKSQYITQTESKQITPNVNIQFLKTYKPFTCYVTKITKNKKTEQYFLRLSEHPMAKDDVSFKVFVASQLVPLVKTLQKESIIRVISYGVSSIGIRKHAIIITDIRLIP